MDTPIRSIRHIALLCLTGMFLLSPTVFAVDGVVLIDQARAMAGNVTPGDAPGFPVSITRSGSYKLSSNLTSPGAVAIHIVADGVTLDLNGFSLVGSFVFPSGEAIVGDDRKFIRIFNGSIQGFSFPLRFLGDAQFVTLEKLHVNSRTLFNGTPVMSVAIQLGRNTFAYSLIREVVAEGQIQITCPSVVVDTIAGGAGGGVVVMALPYNGTGVSFPANCKGANVF
jgi:hypothetical protein